MGQGIELVPKYSTTQLCLMQVKVQLIICKV